MAREIPGYYFCPEENRYFKDEKGELAKRRKRKLQENNVSTIYEWIGYDFFMKRGQKSPELVNYLNFPIFERKILTRPDILYYSHEDQILASDLDRPSLNMAFTIDSDYMNISLLRFFDDGFNSEIVDAYSVNMLLRASSFRHNLFISCRYEFGDAEGSLYHVYFSRLDEMGMGVGCRGFEDDFDFSHSDIRPFIDDAYIYFITAQADCLRLCRFSTIMHEFEKVGSTLCLSDEDVEHRSITEVKWTNDGKTIVACCGDGHIYIFSIHTNREAWFELIHEMKLPKSSVTEMHQTSSVRVILQTFHNTFHELFLNSEFTLSPNFIDVSRTLDPDLGFAIMIQINDVLYISQRNSPKITRWSWSSPVFPLEQYEFHHNSDRRVMRLLRGDRDKLILHHR